MQPNEHGPEQLPEKEQDLIAGYVDELRKAEAGQHLTAVRRARNMLFLAGALIFIWEVVGMLSDDGFDMFVLGAALLEAGIFVGLGLWTHKKPYSAVRGGIIAFIGFIVLAAVINNYFVGTEEAIKSIFGGAILKVAVLVTLFKALGNARSLQNLDKDTF